MFPTTTKMVPNWLSGDLIQPDLFLIFWVYYEFIGTHWHIGTSLVDHTGFNGVLVGLVGLMISRWSKFVCLSALGFFTHLLWIVAVLLCLLCFCVAIWVAAQSQWCRNYSHRCVLSWPSKPRELLVAILCKWYVPIIGRF